MTITTITERFEETAIDVHIIGLQRWMTGPQIAQALGFRDPSDAAKKIYQRSKSEFDDSTTLVLEMPTAGGPQLVRMFNARGAALIAMKARTPRGEAFRRWVLDVLEGEAALPEQGMAQGLSPVVLGNLREMFLARPKMRSLVRYCAMELGAAEIAKLLETTVSYVNKNRRTAEALGLALPPATLAKMQQQPQFLKLAAMRDRASQKTLHTQLLLAAQSGEAAHG
ncbi:MAG: Bro-N domain-containing protein [Sandaracinobacter sp.]